MLRQDENFFPEILRSPEQGAPLVQVADGELHERGPRQSLAPAVQVLHRQVSANDVVQGQHCGDNITGFPW